MGYEIELVFGELNNPVGPENTALHAMEMQYGRSLLEIGRLKMSKVGYGPLGNLVVAAIEEQKAAKKSGDVPAIGFYGDDGDGLVTEDKYGDPVAAIPLRDVAKALQEERQLALGKGEVLYRRFQIAQSMTEAILATFPEHSWSTVVACTFGY